MKTENVVLIIAVVLLSLFVLGGFGIGMMGYSNYGGMWGMMNWMAGGSYNYGTWIFGWLFMILIFVALVLLIVWLVKQIQNK